MTQLIYWSAEPHVLAWAREQKTTRDHVTATWDAFRQHAPLLGVGSTPREPRIIFNLIVGYLPAFDGEIAPPGWMFVTHWGCFVPDPNTNAGREYQHRIDELPSWEGAPDITEIGLPAFVTMRLGNGQEARITPEIVLADEGTHLFCTWSLREVKPVVDSHINAGPQNGWYEMPRSAWYARIERAEAEQVAAARAELTGG